MTLVRFNQPSSVFPYRNLLNGMLNDLSHYSGSDSRASIPAVNVRETESGFQLEVAAPGLQKEHFSVKVEGRVLTVSAENKQETDKEEGKWTRKEFSYTSFSRSFTLPESVDANAIAAKYENGILSVSVAKAGRVKPKSIEIK